MNGKICNVCEKDKADFNKNRNACKECEKLYKKQYYINNKEKINHHNRDYYYKHWDLMKNAQEKYKSLHKKEITEYQKKYRTDNKAISKIYKLEYYRNNKKEIIKKQVACQRKRYRNNINFRISSCLRANFRHAVRNMNKNGSAIKNLGCSIEFLKKHLEQKFYINIKTEKCMTWNNYGKEWEIDHIIPLSTFDLTDENQFYRSVHYTNLQPLWKKDNKEKSNSLFWDWEQT